MNPPSCVVTFLFTDIEGSTRRWEADADAMRSALQAHDMALRTAVTEHGGRVFKHTGDGMCAAFASPRAAVDAAVAAQRIMALPVRMGIATGEAEQRDGDYFGAVLNRVARLMSAGHGGQILLDGQSAGVVGDIALTSLGEKRLRDLSKPVAIHQVNSPGLNADFPPLRTVDPTPGNLRRPGTSFIGREAELAEVTMALKSHQLVTLIGVGGVGKTRLALEAAAKMADGFPDGVWVIELASVGDPAAVPEAVAAELGITQQPGKNITDSVADALEGRSRLLLFDNCEHVLDAAANLIQSIIAHSDSVRILATSREGLRLPVEQLRPVPSLNADSGAASLFVERAAAVTPTTSMSETDEAIVEICRRLDGIPLAIELAASRLQSMSVIEVRDRLDDRFRLLVGSRRGLERHQTLRHAVQWSYDLLDESEQTLLQRCSVFAGGFDLRAACAVAGASDEFAALDLLDAGVRKSLLVADTSSGRTRFSMLETIRQFAEEQLVGTGDADITRAAHARYFAGRETDVLALWDGPGQRQAYAWFTVELANLRTAFRWSVDHDDVDSGAAVAFFAAFLGCYVDQYEPVGWAEELIALTPQVEDGRLAQLYLMASQCYAAGRTEDALGYADGARLMIDSGRFDAIPFEAEAVLGGTYITNGQPERWAELCHHLISTKPGTNLYLRACLVMALAIDGAHDEAQVATEGLLRAADAANNPLMTSIGLLACGFVFPPADPGVADDVLRRGLKIAQDSGNRQFESHLAVTLARLVTFHGDPMDAFEKITVAIRNFYDSGSFSLMPTPLAILAAFFDRLGHHEAAATISGFAANPLTRIAYPEFSSAITHLREVLGDGTYEAHASAGAKMSNAAMATYAFEQIDLARAENQGRVVDYSG